MAEPIAPPGRADPASGPRAFLLLHGYGNHRPPEHWEHWLAAALARDGQRVIYPQLPDPDAPSLAAWRAALDDHLRALAEAAGSGGSERIVLCHSLSCLLWFHAAPTLAPQVRPDRLVLVAPPAFAQVPVPAAEFALQRPDRAAVLASAGTIRLIGSDADPYNPRGIGPVWAQPLGLEAEIVPGGGHLSSGDGFGPWPEMLSWCECPGGPSR